MSEPPAADILREVRFVKQVAGEDQRRWFASGDMDLVVWFDVEKKISAFQLCYDKHRQERALTWKRGQQGFEHATVDDGEAWPLAHKSTPILVPDGNWNAVDVHARFLAVAAELPVSIRDFIEGRLAAQR
jgi:hypothetical protein